jgi:hypothetical protein
MPAQNKIGGLMKAAGSGTRGKQATLTRTLVLGDWGYDHIIVPFAHQLKKYEDYRKDGGKPEHIFEIAPGGATNIEKKVEAGSYLTYKLLGNLEGFDKVDFDQFCGKQREQISEKSSLWSTYSEWLLCQENIADEDIEPDGPCPLWQSRYQWQVSSNPARTETEQQDLSKYHQLVIRDVYLKNSQKASASIRRKLKGVYSTEKSQESPLIILRSTINKIKEKSATSDQDKPCRAEFGYPNIFERMTGINGSKKSTFQENLLNHTVLLLEFSELKLAGAALQDALSWDSLLEETAKTIRRMKSFWKYFAVIVSFHGLGALLYVPHRPGQPNDQLQVGEFTLLFYPGDIENLTGIGATGGLFGNATVLHTALAYELRNIQNVSTTKFRDNQLCLEKALLAGLFASRKLLETGPLRAEIKREGNLSRVTKVKFPINMVCHSIRNYTVANAKRCEEQEDNYQKHLLKTERNQQLPYIFRVTENAFITDEEERERRNSPDKLPKGMLSEQRKFSTEGPEPYPFESILKEALYQVHCFSRDHETVFRIVSDAGDEEKWQHHKHKLTLNNIKQLPKKSALYQLCKNIIEYGSSRFRNVKITGEDGKDHYISEMLKLPADTNNLAAPLAIPNLRIGGSLAYDSTEIKQICDINKQLLKYCKESEQQKPYSICVFGQPGSGKSFIVKELSTNIGKAAGIKREPYFLEFNISQMTSVAELKDAWHRVRDVVLQGKLPFVFFDEFDSALEGTVKAEELGWLKYFISPMQDGTFVGVGGHIHQIGKAVFIFAGGMFESMSDFQKAILGSGEPLLEDGDLRTRKHPDFVSRIRGFINVAGPNERRDGGMLHYLRRATILRTNLEKKFEVGEKASIKVDEQVISAFLNADTYHNNSRSLQGLIAMSSRPLHGPLKVSDIYVDDTLGLYVTSDFADYLRAEEPKTFDPRKRLVINVNKAAGTAKLDAKSLIQYIIYYREAFLEGKTDREQCEVSKKETEFLEAMKTGEIKVDDESATANFSKYSVYKGQSYLRLSLVGLKFKKFGENANVEANDFNTFTQADWVGEELLYNERCQAVLGYIKEM